MNKYIVSLKENRVEIVEPQDDVDAIWGTSFSSSWNRWLLDKYGADIAVWAPDEEGAIEKAEKRYRWSLFDSFELEQLRSAIKCKLEEFAQDDFSRFLFKLLLDELEEAVEQIEEDRERDLNRYRQFGFDRVFTISKEEKI